MTFIATGFTGKERDAETGLDYFGARYFSAAQGRFTSPDPVFFQAGMLTDPQRFNLYAYVRNNPLRYVDPKGEAIELTGTDEERAKKLAADERGRTGTA
jgi:RHS repeat-associated protein